MKISLPNSQLLEIPDEMLLAAYLHELNGQITAIFGVYFALIARLALGWVIFFSLGHFSKIDSPIPMFILGQSYRFRDKVTVILA